MADEHVTIADRLFGAIIAGDGPEIERLVAPAATMWQNTGPATIARADFLAAWKNLASMVPGARLENVRRVATATGFVEQQTLCGPATASEPSVAIQGCFIITVEAGRVTRVEEYVDSAQVAPLMALFGDVP